MERPVTHASMISTDGRNQVYGVYQAILCQGDDPESKPYVDLRGSKRIHTVHTTTMPQHFGYAEIAKELETPEYPAFAFGW